MTLGPLEYLIVAFEGDRFDGSIMEALRSAQEREIIRLVDLLFVRKSADGETSVVEMSDLDDAEAPDLQGVAREMLGLLTAEDVETAAREIPPGTAAAVALLEHTWALELKEAIARAGGTLLAGGLVARETLSLLNAELEASRAAA